MVKFRENRSSAQQDRRKKVESNRASFSTARRRGRWVSGMALTIYCQLLASTLFQNKSGSRQLTYIRTCVSAVHSSTQKTTNSHLFDKFKFKTKQDLLSFVLSLGVSLFLSVVLFHPPDLSSRASGNISKEKSRSSWAWVNQPFVCCRSTLSRSLSAPLCRCASPSCTPVLGAPRNMKVILEYTVWKKIYFHTRSPRKRL